MEDIEVDRVGSEFRLALIGSLIMQAESTNSFDRAIIIVTRERRVPLRVVIVYLVCIYIYIYGERETI